MCVLEVTPGPGATTGGLTLLPGENPEVGGWRL